MSKQDEDKERPLSEQSEALVQDVNQRLDDLPREERTEVLREVFAARREFFSGPQPHPDLLRQYEQICPGSAERILTMGLKEQEARHTHIARVDSQNDEVIRLEKADIHYRRQGMWLGFIVVMFIVGIGCYATYTGQTYIALACFSTTALGIGTAFIQGYRRSSTKEEGSDKPDHHG